LARNPRRVRCHSVPSRILELTSRVAALILMPGLAACAPANGQNQDPVAAYYPAFCSSPGGSVGLDNLEVFPDKGKAIRVSLPFGLGRFAYGPDGRTLYGERRNELTAGSKHELYRIDLRPIRVTAVPAQASLKPIHSIAVSLREDRLLISGGYEEEGNQHCGVFAISLPTGALMSVLKSPDCKYMSAWVGLSLSPDGKRAAAVSAPARSYRYPI
jgi:hypothetical protein